LRNHSKAIGYREASLLETNWSGVARREGIDERKKGNKLLRKNPELAAELLWDSRIAFRFEKLRDKRARRLMRRSLL
jgi:hypothetical protein